MENLKEQLQQLASTHPEYKWEQRIQDVQEQMQYFQKNHSLNPEFKTLLVKLIINQYSNYLLENSKDNEDYLQKLAKFNKELKELGILYLPVSKSERDIKITPEQLAKYVHDSGIETNDPSYQEIINEFRNNAKAKVGEKYYNSGAVQQMTSDLLVYDAMQEEIGETEYLEQGQGRGR